VSSTLWASSVPVNGHWRSRDASRRCSSVLVGAGEVSVGALDRQPVAEAATHRCTQPYLDGVTPDATARLIALPDTLRAWAREDPRVRLHLAAHVAQGLPLGHALARLGQALGDGGDWIVRGRMLAGVQHSKFHPWCSRPLPDGLRCRALATRLVQRAPQSGCVACCEDCARAYEREGAGRTLRAATWE